MLRAPRPRAPSRWRPRSCRATATRPALGAGRNGGQLRAVRHRDPPPAAHRGARGRGAVRAGAEGLLGDAAQAQPVLCERIAGLARLLRGNAHAALENVALWHERDISHSSVERVIFPDACTVLDYMVDRMRYVLGGLVVRPRAMQRNLDATGGSSTPSRCSWS